MTDQYSSYVVAWPTYNIATKTIATQFYHKVFYGTPRRILSDYGAAFAAELSTDLFNLFEVKQCLSTQVTPQLPGSGERKLMELQ